MYSYKEKIKHLGDLSAPVHVHTDLEYLKKVDPRNDQLPTFEHSPERHADRILYNLIDLVTADDIRNNRRRVALEKEAAEKAAKEETERLAQEKEAAEKAAKEEAERLAEEKRAEEEKLRAAALEALQAGASTELEKQKSELEEQLEETEFERDEAIEEKEELEEKLADTETTLEEVKAELEEEKKSEVKPKAPAKPANSKKRTNIRKSTGKTSQTKTSK